MDVTYGVPVDELVTAVKRAIKLANVSNTDVDRDLQVASVFLKLHTIAAFTAGGGLDFRIPVLGMKLKIGGHVSRQETHILEMTLIPEESATRHEVRDSDVEATLVQAIETMRAVMVRAADGDDPFVLQDSSVELTFAVSEDGTISFGAEGDLRDEITHTMRLSLHPPKP